MGKEDNHDLASAPGLAWLIIFALVIALVGAVIKGLDAVLKAISG